MLCAGAVAAGLDSVMASTRAATGVTTAAQCLAVAGRDETAVALSRASIPSASWCGVGRPVPPQSLQMMSWRQGALPYPAAR